jgi:CDP-diglyceride synthetase
MGRTAVTGAALALLCVVFTAVYERFSHGAVSVHMQCMFLMPLVGCALPGLVGYLTPLRRLYCRPAYNLWNSAMAVWTVGCLFRGIVNISGRYTDLDRVYKGAGWILLAAALLWNCLYLLNRFRKNKREDPYHE